MTTRFKIKCEIAKVIGWDIRDFELIPSGKKCGRPNWEIEHHEPPHKRYAFTAFDENDISGLHEVTV